MRARYERDRRARRWRYFLRDLAGQADVKRLLSAEIITQRLHHVADEDGLADQSAPDRNRCRS
jgi:hypothetical protein